MPLPESNLRLMATSNTVELPIRFFPLILLKQFCLGKNDKAKDNKM